MEQSETPSVIQGWNKNFLKQVVMGKRPNVKPRESA